MNRRLLFFAALFAVLLAARLCHSGVQWAEESLPLAAAAQILDGKELYRDIWFDKPPLVAVVCLLWGAGSGWTLRVAGALYGLLACFLAWRFALDLWGEREARLAAALLGFFLVCGIPSAVTPLAADLLTMAPHIAAVWLAARGRPLASGAMAGIAFLVNPKGAIVAAVCAVWNPAGIPLLATGFLAVAAAGAGCLAAAGALGAHYEQVWAWGRIYAGRTFVAEPWMNALARTLSWAGFHSAIAIAAGYGWRNAAPGAARWKWGAWLLLSGCAVAAGMRFFPRYFFQLLPVVVLLAARGFATMPRAHARAVALLLLIPLVRFGPRYVLLATGQSASWADTAMDRDSRAAAARTARMAHRGDRLFVWGFRPEIYTYTKLPAATRFLDSQPLTGVPADRHLTQSHVVDPTAARARRAELARSRPEFVLDGLGPYNPALAIAAYPDLREWLAGYREVGRTGGTAIYRLAGR